ncbi:S-layer homology domain-containing protein, partial [Cohnella lupini]|uniref:S-layer homology domain-containing protein n=1 Tax=Cohnella lupini TaxID=1294267 RepID=UPI001FE453CD
MTIGATNANSPSDIDNNWAKATINQWVDRGWAEGHADGTFKPNNEITRAEVAALINRAFGFRGSASKDFKDVKSTDWYYKDVSAAVDAKYMTGYTDGTFKPNEKISRQELAVMAAKILKLANSDSYRNFVDTVNSPAWSKGGIGAVIDAKIISGFPDKSFRPYKLATRAEVIVILDKAFKLSGNTVTYNYSRQGTYGPSTGETVVDGNVVVKAPGITLRNLSIKGDLLLEEGIGDGEAYLENVTVSGKTTIKGGGSNSIHFKDSALVNVIVNKTDDKIRIVIEGITTIQDIIVESGAKLEEADDAAEGGVKKVTLSELLPAGSKVELVGSFDKVDILTTGIRVIIPKGSVQQLIVAPNATNTNIDLSKDTTIVELVLDANANIVGEGKIEKATINSNGSTLEKKPETVKFKEGVTAKFGNESVPSNPTNGSPPVSTPPPTAAELAATADVVDAEVAANELAGDGTDAQATIGAAQGDRDAAMSAVTALPSSTAKTSLVSRLTAVQSIIDNAQDALDAVKAATAEVEVAEAAANGLTGDGTDTQAAIDAAQGDRDATAPAVTALPNSTAKTSLMSRLAGVQSEIDDAQVALDAVIAATMEVDAAEVAVNGLAGDGTDTQAIIDAAQSDYNAASTAVDALPSSTAKTSLMSRLAGVQSEIDDAQDALDAVNAATAEVEVAEAAVNGLAGDGTDTQAAIDAAQGDRDAASPAVTALPDSTVKTSLMSRLAGVQSTIDDAQDALEALDAINAATAEVEAAEASANGLVGDGTDAQAAIDAAQGDRDVASPAVTALPNSTAKTSLTNRLAAVQAEIDDAQDALDSVNAAIAEVDAAEASADGLAGDGTDTQAAIDAAQSDYNATSTAVDALPSSTAKISLISRLAAVQSTIDDAQDALDAVNAATVEVDAAEASANGLTGDGTDTQATIDAAQGDRDAASPSVTALPNSTAKTSLTSRLAGVQSTIDDAQNALDAVNAATAEVEVAEAVSNGLTGDGTDTQATIDAAQGDRDAASPSVTALPNSTAKTSLTSRLAGVQSTIDDAQNALDAVNAATAEVEVAEAVSNGLTGDGTDTQAA